TFDAYTHVHSGAPNRTTATPCAGRSEGIAPTLAAGSEAPDCVHEVLASEGRPLPEAVRRLLEERFGRSLPAVRLHQNENGRRAACAGGARAFAVGRHVVLGADCPELDSPAGLRLLAHEITHVLQQADSPYRAGRPLRLASPDGPAEREAEAAADQ